VKLSTPQSVTLKWAAFLSVVALTSIVAAPVHAQDADSPHAATMPSTSSAQIAPPADDQPPIGDEGSELMLFKDIPVVVAAGMRQQTLQQAPASVSIVTANDIELFNYRSLADVLRAASISTATRLTTTPACAAFRYRATRTRRYWFSKTAVPPMNSF